MTITIIYDNTSTRSDLRADWGFACVVDVGDYRLLFDTGGSGEILLANMAVLGIDAGSISDVFISHSHFDHSGGLSAFLSANADVRVFAPPELRGIRAAREAVYVDEKPYQIAPGVYSTGLLAEIEQSLVVTLDTKGDAPVVIVGCSHPGVEAILEAARAHGEPRALVGGLHDFEDFPQLDHLSLVCPTHCTCLIDGICRHLPEDRVVPGGAGTVLTL